MVIDTSNRPLSTSDQLGHTALPAPFVCMPSDWKPVCFLLCTFLPCQTCLCNALQSPWIIDGQRKGVSSVEERIADAVLPAFQADRHKIMTAGEQPLHQEAYACSISQ